MNNPAKLYRQAAALLICFCLLAMGNAEVYAICFSQSHPGSFSIHQPCGSKDHHVTHKMPSAQRQGFSQKCYADQYGHENHCLDVLLSAPAQNIQISPAAQLPAVMDSGAFLNTDVMAFFYTRRLPAVSLFPAPSPPVILQTQSFLI
ncbi:hypothetical protein HNR65_002223 [Desulfosalsimonas propionicica]|uniref:Uncharacterized protein n=1 Tax=Desulfosalsimonas propionicica TaxID=332175 RepID=A0A7W0CA50_9BACT|nr:hypothetical protein [Desulfosalsimonas propionicica]MBA2881892.1 hypothetical protein [Desulfosalsimonas propionicica]